MIGRLEFQLPEEQEEFMDAVHGFDYHAVCRDLDEFLRAAIKYAPERTLPLRLEVLQEIRDKLREIQAEAGVPE